MAHCEYNCHDWTVAGVTGGHLYMLCRQCKSRKALRMASGEMRLDQAWLDGKSEVPFGPKAVTKDNLRTRRQIKIISVNRACSGD